MSGNGKDAGVKDAGGKDSTPILELQGLTMRFGGLKAVDGLSFRMSAGSIHGLIGPNGAGKTTTFNVVSGFYRPTAGRILHHGRDITALSMEKVAALGVVRTFQHATLFRELSVRDNVLVGCYLRRRSGLLDAILGRWRGREAELLRETAELLAFFGLEERADFAAGALPHGMQRALGMAIALAARPRLMLLDEPFTGMNAGETETMMRLTRRLRERGVSILLVEHDMRAVMGLCDSITVMNFGRLLAQGTPEEIRSHPEVIAAYLGSGMVGDAAGM